MKTEGEEDTLTAGEEIELLGGFQIGTAEQFLGLTPEEVEFLDEFERRFGDAQTEDEP